jgi:hypothetical protein
MQIWLGKQYLGQSDHATTEVRSLPSLAHVSSSQLRELLDEYTREFPDVAAGLNLIDADYTILESERKALSPPITSARER